MYIHDTSYKGVVLKKILFGGFLSSYSVIKKSQILHDAADELLWDIKLKFFLGTAKKSKPQAGYKTNELQ